MTVSYQARGYEGRTTFSVERDGSIGLAPTWRFAESPLAEMEWERIPQLHDYVHSVQPHAALWRRLAPSQART